MKNIGVWIDKEKAYLMFLKDDNEDLLKIESKIDTYKVHGGSGSKTKWGPQDVVQDSKYLEREKHQLKNYFKEISEHLKSADTIAIFGPAETYLKLEQELKNNYKNIANKVKSVQNLDSMTINQIKAYIRSYFTN